jgi:hypothetical protein
MRQNDSRLFFLSALPLKNTKKNDKNPDMKKKFFITFFLFFGSLSHLEKGYGQLFIGPEVSYVERSKVKGSKQSGCMITGRIGYDQIRRYHIYYGAEASYGSAILRGKSPRKEKIKSTLTEGLAEARMGYTFASKEGWQLSLTPFLGGGYFQQKNDGTFPTPIPVNAKITYWYISTGFFLYFRPIQKLEAGVRFKSRIMLEPVCHISHDPDPEMENSQQNVRHKAQYRVELPLAYQWDCCSCYSFCLVPFYEYQHYGRQSNFPADFLETELHFYGATFELLYSW